MKRLFRCLSIPVLFLVGGTLQAAIAEHWPDTRTSQSKIVLRWNQAALQAVRESAIGPPMVARALAVTHTCIYDAWSAYDGRAIGTQIGERLRRPRNERTLANIERAISYAAFRCASDLFPGSISTAFIPLMRDLAFDPNDLSQDITTPQGIGNFAAMAVIAYRRSDGANQLGNLTASGVPYADYTGYITPNAPSLVPVNPATVTDINQWQPLQYFDATGAFVTQRYLAPFWGRVKPFAAGSSEAIQAVVERFAPFRSSDPQFLTQAQELVELSANLTDEQKMMAEYWADGPRSETPPGHWNLFAQYVSSRDHNDVEADVKLFFALTNALLDASIAVWERKLEFNSVRPITAIPYLYNGRTIQAWGGPGQKTIEMDGRNWIPYQASTSPTPPFAEFPSGHSTFSAAAATVLRLFTHSDRFGASVSFLSGTSKYEPGTTPATMVTLRWKTFSEAAAEAGMSRRYGGIHFRNGDIAGRAMGRIVGLQAWQTAESFWTGSGLGKTPWE